MIRVSIFALTKFYKFFKLHILGQYLSYNKLCMNLKLIKEKKKKINSGPTLTIAAFLAQAQIKIT